MPAALQLLSDESILTTGKLSCKAESIISKLPRTILLSGPASDRALRDIARQWKTYERHSSLKMKACEEDLEGCYRDTLS